MATTSTTRVALAQQNSTVGDLDGNRTRVLHRVREAAQAGAQLVVFPELILTGYPPEDLVLRAAFRAASRRAVARLAVELAEAGLAAVGVVVGYIDDDGGARNAAAFLHDGQVRTRYYKHHLPNYGVFDEHRYFRPGHGFVHVDFRGIRWGLTICEDAWQDGGPFAQARAAGAQAMLSLNASPFERGKAAARVDLLAHRAREAGAPIIYVNAVGGQDELVFDGGSMVVDADGVPAVQVRQFSEGLTLIDVSSTGDVTPVPAAHPNGRGCGTADDCDDGDEAQVWGALVLGLRDYVVKNGFTSVLLGLSGGIDSAVVAALAADAIGGANVHGVAMPSAYSSAHSRADAAESARRGGLQLRTVEIAGLVEPFVSSLGLSGLAEENVQARVRGTTLMAISNGEGHLVLATGNKSELAVGYSTIYGDAVGGFAPIKDVPKTLVWQLARWRNAQAAARGEVPPIPESSIVKAPSAELRPGQLDTDSLPDYDVLDAIVHRYVDGDESVADIVAAGFDAATVTRVARLINRAEWKRRQYPPGTKISLKSFGRDRRLPITNGWREDSPPGQ